MVKHKHQWILLKKWDNRPKHEPLPKGQWIPRGGLFGGVTYIPGFDMEMVRTRVIEIIQETEMPYYTFQTYQCPECGKIKEYSQRHEGLLTSLKATTKGNDLPTEGSKPAKS